MTTKNLDTTLYENRLDETFRVAPPNALLPKALHADLTDYETWTDTAEEDRYTASRAEHLLAQADAADLAAAEEATEAGESPSGTPNRDQAEATVRDAELRFRVAQRQQRKAARALITGMREHETTITRTVRDRVSSALGKYSAALNEIESQLDALASTLEQETAAVRMVEELRAGEDRDLEFGLVAVPRPDIGEAVKFTSALTDRLRKLSEPAVSAYVHVIGPNGQVMKMQRSPSVEGLIDAGHARYATPAEITQAGKFT